MLFFYLASVFRNTQTGGKKWKYKSPCCKAEKDPPEEQACQIGGAGDGAKLEHRGALDE